MPDLFKEILPSILRNKKNVFENGDYSDYNAFIVNRALSYHLDCLPYVAEMSSLSHLDKDMQYQYLINTIRSFKRDFHKWQKVETVEDLECVKTYFGYSNQKAKEALRILTNEQLVEIRKKTEKGGVKK
jgi:Bacteriophage clamp loader A subunit